MSDETPKLLIWMNCPTHHQRHFFQALRDQGVDLKVRYHGELDEDRKKQGWQRPNSLPSGEQYVDGSAEDALRACPDWRERTHTVAGFNSPFKANLTRIFLTEDLSWMPWIEHVWDLYPTGRKSNLFKWSIKRLAFPMYGSLVNRYATGALTFSHLGLRALASWGVERDRIKVLPYTVPAVDSSSTVDPPLKEFAATSDGPLFLYLGQLCYRKGIDILLDAFSKLEREHPSARLALVGHDQTDGKYEDQAKQLGLEKKVLFRGVVDSNAIDRVYAASDVFVLPSRDDGWGVVLNEACSVGLPVIATDRCGSSHHLLKHAQNGYRIRAGNARALAWAMSRYLECPDLVNKHGNRSENFFQAFTPERNAERMIEYVRELKALD